jgi:hypothetical protein
MVVIRLPHVLPLEARFFVTLPEGPVESFSFWLQRFSKFLRNFVVPSPQCAWGGILEEKGSPPDHGSELEPLAFGVLPTFSLHQ